MSVTKSPRYEAGPIRQALRSFDRGQLLVIAERALALVPPAALDSLLGDYVRLEPLLDGGHDTPSLLDEAIRFHAECLRGFYYAEFEVSGKTFTQHSRGTDAFIAELDRLIRWGIVEATQDTKPAVRRAFELVFEVIARLDREPAYILFFGDEGGSWGVWSDRIPAYAAYVGCLAHTEVSAEAYAECAIAAIDKIAGIERPRCLELACKLASPEQRAAVERLLR